MAYSIRRKLRRLARGIQQPRRSLQHLLGLCMLLVAACQGKFHTSPTPDSTESNGVDTASPDLSTLSDEALLREAIAGHRDAEKTFKTIYSRGGFPVKTSNGQYLFAHLAHSTDWSLTGNFNDWALLPMNQSDAIWWLETSLPVPDGTQYKFSNGEQYIPDPYARRYDYDAYGEHSLVESSAAHLERWHGAAFGSLQERTIRVWVPDNGRFEQTLFVHDAQNIFSPNAPWGGWKLQESLPENTLVVGLDNTSQRMEEYTHTADTIDGVMYGGLGNEYADYLHLKIRPFIELQYGTARKNGLMGASLGGLISLYTALRYPDQYDMSISLSGTVGWGKIEQNNPTIIDLFEAAGVQPFAIYIDSGGGDDCTDEDNIVDSLINSPDNYCENLLFRDTLTRIGYRFDVSLWHWHEDGAEHNEAAWAARVWRPISYFSSL